MINLIRDTLGKLPPDLLVENEADIARLRFFESKTEKELASIYKLPLGEIRKILYVIRDKIAQQVIFDSGLVPKKDISSERQGSTTVLPESSIPQLADQNHSE